MYCLADPIWESSEFRGELSIESQQQTQKLLTTEIAENRQRTQRKAAFAPLD
jgi:hypothetical protein